MDQQSSKKQEYYHRSENLFKVRGIMYWYYVLLVIMVLVTVNNAGFYFQKVPNHSDDQQHEGRNDLYSQRLPKYLDRNESSTTHVIGFYIAQYAAAGTTTHLALRRKAQESFITLVIKFLNFCIAKSLQFRYSLLPNLPSAAISSSFVFWVVLTRSVFSLYY